MEQLLRTTEAYKILAREARENRLSNAYLLLFDDRDNLRQALKVFSGIFFGNKNDTYARIQRENHPDCLVYPPYQSGRDEKSKKPKLDTKMVETVIEESFLHSIEGEGRLFVLDDMQNANESAQNKLLKVLEEPAPNVHFLLGATTDYALLPTVISRTEKLVIEPFTDEALVQCLRRRHPEIAKGEIEQVAQVADGSLGRAERLLSGRYYEEMADKAFKCVAATVHTEEIPAVSRGLNSVEEKAEFVLVLRKMFRDLLFISEEQPYYADGAYTEPLRGLAEKIDSATLIFALEATENIEKQLAANMDLSQCVEVALLKIGDRNKRGQGSISTPAGRRQEGKQENAENSWRKI